MGEIDRLVGLVPQWHGLGPVIEPLALGITNRNYRVALTDARSYVVRLPGERTDLLGIDRPAEVEASRRAASLGIGPPVFGELPTVGTLITEFLPGEHADFTPNRVAIVVGLLRALHGSGPLTHPFPIFRIVERHANDAQQNGVTPPAAYEALRGPAERIERVFAGEPLVPCHNDLLPANVLFHGSQAWLLDFEYAGMNVALFDLANLSVNGAFDHDADEHLLAAYFGDVTPRHRARLQLMKIMSEYREGMWGVVQSAISTLDTDFASYARGRLANCLALVAHGDFEQWLRDAAAAPGPASWPRPPSSPWAPPPRPAWGQPLPPPPTAFVADASPSTPSEALRLRTIDS